MRYAHGLLIGISFAIASVAHAQSAGVMTVEISPTGTTQVRYFIASTYCNWGFPQSTEVDVVSGGWDITTELYTGVCFAISPPGPPATLVADLGYLRQGQYTVTWSFAGGIGYGTRSTTFTIAEDQLPNPVPTITPLAMLDLSLMLGAAAVGAILRRAKGL